MESNVEANENILLAVDPRNGIVIAARFTSYEDPLFGGCDFLAGFKEQVSAHLEKAEDSVPLYHLVVGPQEEGTELAAYLQDADALDGPDKCDGFASDLQMKGSTRDALEAQVIRACSKAVYELGAHRSRLIVSSFQKDVDCIYISLNAETGGICLNIVED